MARFKEIKIRSLGDLLNKVTPSRPDKISGRFRNISVFRGAEDPEWKMLTSLDRLGGVKSPHAKAHLEEHILRNFLRFARPFLKETTNTWELLVTAQHHGLPTRLLDWTYSPVVAAHFATLREDRKGDRVIWKLDWRGLHEHFQLKPLAFLVSDLDEVLGQRGFQSPWEFFNSPQKVKDDFVCLLDPPVLDARMEAQAAAFTLSSNKTKPLDRLLVELGLERVLVKYVIPKNRVAYIRDQLDLAGVDERKLFPGLDGIASEIRRYYAASGPIAVQS